MAGADAVLTRVASAAAALDDAALEALVGAGAVRLGRRDAAAPPRVEGDAVRVAVGAFEVTVRGGAADARCSCAARRACRHVVAAMLALRALAPSEPAPSPSKARAPRRPAPPAPADALALVAPLDTLLDDGLARLTHGTPALVRALAASARAADRPRVEAALGRLAGEVELQLARDARASTTALLDALAAAWEAATASDPGRWRGDYAPVGTLRLAGLGARAWSSERGWRGLTLYFSDEENGSCLTWTEARRQGLRPEARFREDGPWEGAPALQELCRREVRLDGAWRDDRGRISSRPSTRCEVGGPAAPLRTAGVVDDFREVARRALRESGGPHEETALVVVLKPAAWQPARFDPVTQASTRWVADTRGLQLPVSLPYDPGCPGAQTIFEGATPDGVLGRVWVTRGTLCVEPWVLYCADRVVNLTLDVGGETAATDGSADTEPSRTALGQLLSRVEAVIERWAERGRPRPPTDDLVHTLEAVGLDACARALAAARGSASEFLAAWRMIRRAGRLEAIAAAAERAGIDID